MIEVRRYTAVLADVTRSIVVMLGCNNNVIPVNSGPSYSPQEDPRKLKGAWAVVIRANAVVPGVVVSFVTLTGNTGEMWLLELGKSVQGSGDLAQLGPCDYKLKYNVGVLIGAGALLADDMVQIGAVYD